METLDSQDLSKGIYLYAFVLSSNQPKPLDNIMGIENKPVSMITYKEISILGTSISSESIMPEKKNLFAHYEVLKKLLEEEAVLPMRFGMLANNEKEVLELIRRRYDEIYENLTEVKGKVEMTLSLNWNVKNIFEYFIQRYSELEEARKDLTQIPSSSPRELLIKTGELFNNILNTERESYTERMKQLITPPCEKIVANTPRYEKEIMNLACLIPRKDELAFENAVNIAAEQWNEDFLISYSGPSLPYNFVKLHFEE